MFLQIGVRLASDHVRSVKVMGHASAPVVLSDVGERGVTHAFLWLASLVVGDGVVG